MSPNYYAELSERVKDVLRREFGTDVTIRTDEGWHGRIQTKIVSSAFDGRTEDEKQAMVWEALQEELGPDATGVSLVLACGMDEI
jgi:hypothetical protein